MTVVVAPRTALSPLTSKLSALEQNVQGVVRGDEIGLARGIFWISQACLDQACTQKKISLVTINLP